MMRAFGKIAEVKSLMGNLSLGKLKVFLLAFFFFSSPVLIAPVLCKATEGLSLGMGMGNIIRNTDRNCKIKQNP